MSTVLVVDGANVVGSRPDGWWRDRLAAAARLRDRLAQIAESGPEGMAGPVEVILVVEGAARALQTADRVRVAAADGAGDDLIVQIAAGRASATDRVVVVTADRLLRARVVAAGAEVRGPRWLTRQFDDPPPGPVSDF
jgi:predicted RNA-binding protein with PIN domain